jgi:hypothetical protein
MMADLHEMWSKERLEVAFKSLSEVLMGGLVDSVGGF